MPKTLISCLAVAAALALNASPSLAMTLDELPECPASTPDEMAIYSPRETLLVGRAAAFRVAYEGSAQLGDMPLRFSGQLDGRPIAPTNISAQRFEITPDQPGRLRVGATYALGERYDYRQRATLAPCRTTGYATWKVVRLTRFPRMEVQGYGEKVEFALDRQPRRECVETYDRTPISLNVSQRGGRRLVSTASASDPCSGFDAWTDFVNVPWWRTFYFGGLEGDPRWSLMLSLQWPEKRSARWRFDYVVRVGHRVAQRGSIITRTKYHAAERVYAWLPGNRINDDYWNICVNDGKRIAMDNGNPYCNVGGYYERSVSLR